MTDQTYIDFTRIMLTVEGKNPKSYSDDDINKAATVASGINDPANIQKLTGVLLQIKPEDRNLTKKKFLNNAAFNKFYLQHQAVFDNFFSSLDAMKPSQPAPSTPAAGSGSPPPATPAKPAAAPEPAKKPESAKQPAAQPDKNTTIIGIESQPDLPHLQFVYDKSGKLTASLVNSKGEVVNGGDGKPVTYQTTDVNPELLKKNLKGLPTPEARWAFINTLMTTKNPPPAGVLRNMVVGSNYGTPNVIPPETAEQKKEWAKINPQNNTPEMNAERDKAAGALMTQMKASVGDQAIAGLTADNIKSAFLNDEKGTHLMQAFSQQLEKQVKDPFYADWKKGINPNNGRGDVASQTRLLKAHQIASAAAATAKAMGGDDPDAVNGIYDKLTASINAMKQSALANGNTDMARILATAAVMTDAYKHGASYKDLYGEKGRALQAKAEASLGASAANPAAGQTKPPDHSSPAPVTEAHHHNGTGTAGGETPSSDEMDAIRKYNSPGSKPPDPGTGLYLNGKRKVNPRNTQGINYYLPEKYTTEDLNTAELARVTPAPQPPAAPKHGNYQAMNTPPGAPPAGTVVPPPPGSPYRYPGAYTVNPYSQAGIGPTGVAVGGRFSAGINVGVGVWGGGGYPNYHPHSPRFFGPGRRW